MDGQLIPGRDDYFFITPAWRNLFENHFTVQFNHRVMAYALVALAIWHAVSLSRSGAPRAARATANAVAGLMLGHGGARHPHAAACCACLARAGCIRPMRRSMLIMVTVHAQRLAAAPAQRPARA